MVFLYFNQGTFMANPEFIHPTFKSMADTSLAEACSDIFTKDYKFTTESEITDRYGDEGFPPTPSHLVSVTATYLETSQTGEPTIRTQFASMRPDLASLDKVAGIYQTTVGRFQEMTGIFTAIEATNTNSSTSGSGTEDMQAWYINKVASSGGRLLAAHITACTVEDEQLFDTVAVPKAVFEELPLRARDTITTLKPKFDEVLANDDLSLVNRDQLDSVLKTFLSNDPVLQNLGSIAASTFLPDAKIFVSKLQAERPDRIPSTKPGGNRAQRRKQHRRK